MDPIKLTLPPIQDNSTTLNSNNLPTLKLPPINPATNFGGTINLGEYKDTKYDIGKPIDVSQEDWRGQEQGRLEKWAYSLPRTIGKFGLESNKGFAYATALGEAMFTDSTLPEALDNSFLRAADVVDQKLKDMFQIYTPKDVREGGILNNITSASFYTNEGADALGYLMSAMVPGTIFGKVGAISRLGELANVSSDVLKTLDLGALSLYQAGIEGMAETQEYVRNTEPELMKLVGEGPGKISLEEAKDRLAQGARNVLNTNLAVLVGPNMLMNKWLLGRYFKDNDASKLLLNAEKGIFEAPTQLTFKENAKNFLKNAGLATFSEGFWEEGIQGVTTDLNKKLALAGKDPGMIDYINDLANEYTDKIQTTDQQKSIFLGALLGTGAAVHESLQENKERKNLSGLANFLELNRSLFNTNISNLIVNENGEDKINTDKLKELFHSDLQARVQSHLMDAAAISGKKDVYDFLFNKSFTQFVVPFLKFNDGLETLHKYLDLTSEKLTEGSKKLDPNFNKNDEAKFIADLKNKSKEIKKDYEKYSSIIDRVNPDWENKEEVADLKQRLKDGAVSESSYLRYLKDELKSVNEEMQPYLNRSILNGEEGKYRQDNFTKVELEEIAKHREYTKSLEKQIKQSEDRLDQIVDKDEWKNYLKQQSEVKANNEEVKKAAEETVNKLDKELKTNSLKTNTSFDDGDLIQAYEQWSNTRDYTENDINEFHDQLNTFIDHFKGQDLSKVTDDYLKEFIANQKILRSFGPNALFYFKKAIGKTVTEEEKESVKSKDNIISDEIYNNFIDKGIVPQNIINNIAEKIKNNEPLNERETAIFNDKTTEINKRLVELQSVQTKKETGNTKHRGAGEFLSIYDTKDKKEKDDIERRRQEELDDQSGNIRIKTEIVEGTSDNGEPTRILIHTNKDGSRTVQYESKFNGEQTWTRVSTEKVNADVIVEARGYANRTYNIQKPRVVETIENPRSLPSEKINAKYDAELAAQSSISNKITQDPDIISKIDSFLITNNKPSDRPFTPYNSKVDMGRPRYTVAVRIKKDGKIETLGYLPFANQFYYKGTKDLINIQKLTEQEYKTLFEPDSDHTLTAFKEAHKTLTKFEKQIGIVSDAGRTITNSWLKNHLIASVTPGNYSLITPSESLTPADSWGDRALVDGKPIIVEISPSYTTDKDSGKEVMTEYGLPRVVGNSLFTDEDNNTPEWLKTAIKQFKDASNSVFLSGNNTPVSRYAMLVKDAGGTVVINKNHYSWVYLHPKTLNNPEEFIQKLNKKQAELNALEFDKRDAINQANKELNKNIFIPATHGLSVTLNYYPTKDGVKLSLNYYNKGIDDQLIIDGASSYEELIYKLEDARSKSTNEKIRNSDKIVERTIRENIPTKPGAITLDADSIEDLLDIRSKLGSLVSKNIKDSQNLNITFQNLTPVEPPINKAKAEDKKSTPPAPDWLEPDDEASSTPTPDWLTEAYQNKKEDKPFQGVDPKVRIKEIKEKLKNPNSLSTEEYKALNNEFDKLIEDLNDDEDSANKISRLPSEKKIDLDAATSYLNSILPSFITTKELDVVHTNLGKYGTIFGKFANDVIYLSRQAAPGTEYHEAFHAVFRTLLTQDEIVHYRGLAKQDMLRDLKAKGITVSKAVEEFRNSHPDRIYMSEVDLQNLMLEEHLADKFQIWKENKNKPKGLIEKLFEKIMNFINWIKGMDSRDIDSLYHNIDTGYYKNMSKVSNMLKSRPVYVLVQNDLDTDTNLPMYENIDDTEVKLNTIIATLYDRIEEYNKKQLELPSEKQKLVDIDNKFQREKFLLDIFKEKAWEYNLDNPIYEGRDKAEVANGGVISLGEYLRKERFTFINKKSKEALIDMINYKLSKYKLSGLQESLGETNDNEVVAERNYDINQENIGGYASLSQEMRQYIGLTTFEYTDMFGINRVRAVDNKKVYDGITRGCVNSLSEGEVIRKLYQLLEYGGEQSKRFIEKLFKDMGIDPAIFESNDAANINDYFTGLENGSKRAFYQRFVKAFNLFSFDHNQIGVKFVGGGTETNVNYSNKRNVEHNQVAKWGEDYNQFIEPKFIEDPKLKQQNIDDLNEFIDTKLKAKKPFSQEGIKKQATELKKLLNNIGIKVSDGYCKYLLVSNPLTLDKINKKQLESYITFKNEMSQTQEEFIKSLEIIISLIQKSKDPFVRQFSEVDGQELVDDKTDAVTKLQNIAKDNALFDESISNTSFKSVENKTLYGLQQATYEAIQTLKIAKDPTYLNQLLKDEPYMVGNFLLNSPDFKMIQKYLNIERADGLYEEIDYKTINKQDGVTFASMKDRDFMIYQLGLALDYKTKTILNKDKSITTVTTSPMIVSIMETSSTADIVRLPVIKETISSKGISASYRENIFKEITREYERIQRIKNGEEKDWYGYSVPDDKGVVRGLDFWINKDLLSQNPEIYEQLKSGKTNPEQLRDEINNLIDSYLNNKIDEFIEDLKDLGMIRENNEGKLINVLLDRRFEGIATEKKEKIFDTSDLKLNLSKVFLSTYLNNIAFNQLMIGDPSFTVKDAITYFKRNKSRNASGVSVYSDSFPVTSFAVFEEPKLLHPGNDKSTSIADAQSLALPEYFMKVYESLGRLDAKSRKIYQVLIDGDRDITYEEQQYLNKKNCAVNATKFAGSDRNLNIKTSTALLHKRLVGYTNNNGEFVPIPGREELFHLYNEMKNKYIDLIMPPTAMKRAIKSVAKRGADGKYNLTRETIDNNFFRLQMENPSNKKYIKYPTQVQSLLPFEVISNEGKSLVNDYKNNFTNLMNNNFNLLNKVVKDYENNVISLNYFKKIATEVLQSSGATNNMLAFFSPEYNYNLNLESTITKFRELYTSHFKSAFNAKIPGYKTTLQSDFGISIIHYTNDPTRIVTLDQFHSDPNRYQEMINQGILSTRKLEERYDEKEKITYAECMISKHFAEQFNLKPGDELPKELIDCFGNRIPASDKHSMTPLRIVDILPTSNGSNLILPSMLIDRIGHDFDVDAFYVHRPAHYVVYNNVGNPIFRKYGNKDTETHFEQYMRFVFENKVIMNLYKNNLESVDNDTKYKEILTLYKQILKNKNIKAENFEGKEQSVLQPLLNKNASELLNTYLEDKDLRDFTQDASETGDLHFEPNSIFIGVLKQLGYPTNEKEYNIHVKKNGEINDNIIFNQILDNSRKIWSLEEMKELRNQPETDKPLERIGNKLATIKGLKSYNDLKESRDPFTINGINQAYSQNRSGSVAIGAAVNAGQAFTLLNQYRVSLINGIKFKINGIEHNSFNKTTSRFKDIDGVEKRIMDNHSTNVVGATDSGKTNYPGLLNLDIDSLSVVSTLVSRGVPLETAVFIGNLNSIKELMRRSSGAKLKTTSEIDINKKEIFQQLENQYINQYGKIIKDNNLEDNLNLNDIDISSEDIENTLSEFRGLPTEVDKAARNLATHIKALNIWNSVSNEAFEIGHLNQLIKLNKGLEGTADFSANLEKHINGIGYNYKIVDGEVKLYKDEKLSKNLNIDFSNIVENDISFKTRVEKAMQFVYDSREVFIDKTNMFINLKNYIRSSMRPTLKNSDRVMSDLDRNLRTFITIKAYKNYLKKKGLNEDFTQLEAGLVFKQLNGEISRIPNNTINVYWGQNESESSTRILSNLAPRKFTYEGKEYGSVEHAYQTLKSGSFDKNTYDTYITKGGYGVKIRGLSINKNFDNLQLMKNLVVESFKQNPNSEASKKLLQYSNFTHNTNEIIDKAFLEGLKLAQKELQPNSNNEKYKYDAVETLYLYKNKYPELAKNPFIRALQTSTREDVSFIKYNTRSNGNKGFEDNIVDGYMALYKDPTFKPLAKMLFNYVIMKDSGQFKNDSYLNLLPHNVFKEMSEVLDVVQDLLSKDSVTEESFQDVFNVSKNNLLAEFNEIYFRYIKNRSMLRKQKNFSSTNTPYKTKINENGLRELTVDLKNNVKKDERINNGVITVDRYTSSEFIDEQISETFDEKRKEFIKTLFANKDVIKKSFVFELQEDELIDKNKTVKRSSIRFPLYFASEVITDDTKEQLEGEENKLKHFTVFKLKSLDDKDFTYGMIDKDSNMAVGQKAIYEEVKSIGNKDVNILPYSFTVQELEQIANLNITKQIKSGYRKPLVSLEEKEKIAKEIPDFLTDMYSDRGETTDEADNVTSEIKPNLPEAAGYIITQNTTHQSNTFDDEGINQDDLVDMMMGKNKMLSNNPKQPYDIAKKDAQPYGLNFEELLKLGKFLQENNMKLEQFDKLDKGIKDNIINCYVKEVKKI